MTVYPNDVHARLHALNLRIRSLLDRAPAAVQNANDAIRRVDGFGERGDSAGRGSSVTTSVESAIVRQEQIGKDLADLVARLIEIEDPLRTVESIVARWEPTIETKVEHSTCTGGKNSEPWSKKECGNWVGYSFLADGSISERGDGLCDACRMRKVRHEKKMAEESSIIYSTG